MGQVQDPPIQARDRPEKCGARGVSTLGSSWHARHVRALRFQVGTSIISEAESLCPSLSPHSEDSSLLTLTLSCVSFMDSSLHHPSSFLSHDRPRAIHTTRSGLSPTEHADSSSSPLSFQNVMAGTCVWSTGFRFLPRCAHRQRLSVAVRGMDEPRCWTGTSSSSTSIHRSLITLGPRLS